MAAAAPTGPMKVGARFEVAPHPKDIRDQINPRIAFDDDETYLVVWQQGRDYFEMESADIFAARVSCDGKLIDANPIAICTVPDSQVSPAVAFAGGVFLVVWSDLRNGNDFDVYAARVTPGGKVLDKDGFLVSGGARNQCEPAVTSGNGKFLAAWMDFRDDKGYAIYVARVSPQGKSLDGQGVALTGKDGPMRGGSISLARVRKNWYAFWQLPVSGTKGAVARIEEAGGSLSVAESAGPLPNFSGCMGAPASDGKMVIYAGTAVSGRGGGFRPGTVLLFDPASCQPRDNPNPPIGAGASGWNEKQMICAHIPTPGLDGPMAAAASEGVFLVAAKGSCMAKPPFSQQIHAARLAAGGKLIESPDAWQVLDDGAQPCHCPSLAAGKGGVFMLVYSVDAGPGKQRVVARRVSVN